MQKIKNGELDQYGKM